MLKKQVGYPFLVVPDCPVCIWHYSVKMDSIELNLFNQRIRAISEEMGVQLCRAAFSPNIRDRLDYSCAIFDAEGKLVAQAAHIPVHLGSMAHALERLVGDWNWQAGDMLVFNHPLYGGTHLPDITVVAPAFLGSQCIGFVANRAHHADIGAIVPGGMPISTSLEQEGLLIRPQHLVRQGVLQEALLESLVENTASPIEQRGDFLAQIAANKIGLKRLQFLVSKDGVEHWLRMVQAINDYSQSITQHALQGFPEGSWVFEDYLDGDGIDERAIKMKLRLTIRQGTALFDFTGTAGPVSGNLNCPPAVCFAAVYYVFRLFLPPFTPLCHGTFSSLDVFIPENSLLNATGHSAVAGGNVETSSRMVDCLLGVFAQALPEQAVAASQGTMNNIALGSTTKPAWSYYETIAGGCGASASGAGASAVQSHMTNTLNTPIEVLEMRYPLRVRRYAIRHGSGGGGQFCGGEGVIREYQFLREATATILSERRRYAPWGVAQGKPGACGENYLNGKPVPGKCHLELKPGDCLSIHTPGGGGWAP